MRTSTNSICNIEYEKFIIGAMLLKDGVIVPTTAYAEFYAKVIKKNLTSANLPPLLKKL